MSKIYIKWAARATILLSGFLLQSFAINAMIMHEEKQADFVRFTATNYFATKKIIIHSYEIKNTAIIDCFYDEAGDYIIKTEAGNYRVLDAGSLSQGIEVTLYDPTGKQVKIWRQSSSGNRL